MNNHDQPGTSAQDPFEDDEIFDDSTFLANFDKSIKTKTHEGDVKDSANTSSLNISALCCDEEISGYDKLTGQTWIYPTNYPVRDYQFNIIKAALLKNTLVSLPTGLGKTFIAAVVMYNFYRWYPLGKIVFTAPTRPLVAQQIDACYNIIAIPPNDTIEMTGHMQVNTRKSHWQSKRVFFATPQVIYNDIKSGICPAELIRCLVIDEAHRARGNYAYCQIVSTLDEMGHKTYRMLALSATPGSKVDDVVNVVKSLHIANLELRTENCIDVAPYSHSRKVTTVVVNLGPELTQLRQNYVEILDGYARRLKQFNILPQNLGNLSKGRIVMLYKEYQTKDRGQRHAQHNYIMKDFTILIALYHGLELLVKHGSRVFLNFFDEHPEKAWIQADDRLTALLERLRDDLGVNPLSLDRSILPDGTIPEMPKDLRFGHPKFDKLKSIVMDHFTTAKQKNQDTRAIIFCEYRESVNLVHCLLLQCRPLVSAQMFVGQGASGKDGQPVVSQKQQLRVMRGFRAGACNTLVATCVAEEGLDVGSVDLILCFDISTRSPVRLVQRCGRTGRERGGQVYILVTEGREHQTLLDCMRQRDGLNKRIQQSREVAGALYRADRRMMPRDLTPRCQKMYITVLKKDEREPADKHAKKGQKDLRSMLLSNRASSSGSSSGREGDSSLITEREFAALFPGGYRRSDPFTPRANHWTMNRETFKVLALDVNHTKSLNMASWLEWQRNLQKTVNVDHTKDSIFLVETLQKCDMMRLEPSQNPVAVVNTQSVQPQEVGHLISEKLPAAPVLQSPIKATKQTKKRKAAPAKSPGKNYGDIRALFSSATKSTKSYTKLINDLGIQNDGSVSTKLLNLLVDLNLNVENTNQEKKCYACEMFRSCNSIRKISKNCVKSVTLTKFLSDPILPDLDLIDEIKSEYIVKYGKDNDESREALNDDKKDLKAVAKNDNANCSNNFDLEFDLDALDEMNSPEAVVEGTAKINVSDDKNFDLGDIDDIFADSSPEEAVAKEIQSIIVEKTDDKVNQPTNSKPTETQETLGFFGLDSIDDIFADYDDDDDFQASTNVRSDHHQIISSKDKQVETSGVKEHANSINKDATELIKKPLGIPNNNERNAHPLSPSILTGKPAVQELPTSPILCSQVRKFQQGTKNNKPISSTPNRSAKKKLLLPQPDNDMKIIDDDKKVNKTSTSAIDTSDKSMLTITQIVDMINKTNRSHNDTVKTTEHVNLQNERSMSPILLTQADKKRTENSNSKSKAKETNNNRESLIILDSDSDFDDTQPYECNVNQEVINVEEVNKSPVGVKRKFDPDTSLQASPYFNKKQKIDNVTAKPLTLQEKVLAAVSSNKTKTMAKNDDNKKTTLNNDQHNFHFTVSEPQFYSQKENKNPYSDVDLNQSPLQMLQGYRKENKLKLTLKSNIDAMFKKRSEAVVESPKHNIIEDSDSVIEDRLFNTTCNTNEHDSETYTPIKRKITFSDSDDDFATDKYSRKKPANKQNEIKSTTNHKVRKKMQHNSLLELEASVSDDSGDELSDDSAGSIADFICDDEDVTRADIRAVYLESVRSPVRKNGFKIPELPNKYRREDILSQFVEEDDYEMDSFCVDSHVGLTQVNDDVSELELAEIVLEEKRRNRRKKSPPPAQTTGDSPLIRRVFKHCKRQINSDSDDSS